MDQERPEGGNLAVDHAYMGKVLTPGDALTFFSLGSLHLTQALVPARGLLGSLAEADIWYGCSMAPPSTEFKSQFVPLGCLL